MFMVSLTRSFVWDAGGTEDTFDSKMTLNNSSSNHIPEQQHSVGLPGIGINFIIKATSATFIRISEIRIIVYPYT